MIKFTKLLESFTDTLTTDDELIDVQTELIEMIEETINVDDNELKKETMNSYIIDSSTTIIGLVNDSDIFDLYLKHKNHFDNILNEIEHFDKSPISIGSVSSLYEYVIESTRLGVQEIFRKMSNENI